MQQKHPRQNKTKNSRWLWHWGGRQSLTSKSDVPECSTKGKVLEATLNLSSKNTEVPSVLTGVEPGRRKGLWGRVLPELWRLLQRPHLSNSLIKKQNKNQRCMCREINWPQAAPSAQLLRLWGSTTSSKLELTAGRSHRQLTDVILPGW